MKLSIIILILLLIDPIMIGNCYLCFDRHSKDLISLFVLNNTLYQYSADGFIKIFQLWKIESNPVKKHLFYVDKLIRNDHIKNYIPIYLFKNLNRISFASIDQLKIVLVLGFSEPNYVKIFFNKGKDIYEHNYAAKDAILISSQTSENNYMPLILKQYNSLNVNLTFTQNIVKFEELPYLYCFYSEYSHTKKMIQLESESNCKENHLHLNVIKSFLRGFQSGFIYNNQFYLISFPKNLIVSFDFLKLMTNKFTTLIEQEITDIFRCKPMAEIPVTNTRIWIYSLTVIIILMLILVCTMNCCLEDNFNFNQPFMFSKYNQGMNGGKGRLSWFSNWNWVKPNQFWSKISTKYNSNIGSIFSTISSNIGQRSSMKSKNVFLQKFSPKTRNVSYGSSSTTKPSIYPIYSPKTRIG